MAALSASRVPFVRLATAMLSGIRRRGAAASTQGSAARERPGQGTAPPRRVLVLYPFGRLLPALVEFDRGLREQIDRLGGGPVEVYEEFLDWPRFDGPEHVRTVTAYLQHKYVGRQPDALVTARANGARFALALRETTFPDVAIVFAALRPDELAALSPLPAGAAGVVAPEDYCPTASAALRWHPRARRVVTVTGASQVDARWTAQLRADLSRLPGSVEVEHWTGLPTRDVLARLARLGRESVVVTPGYFEDGAGERFWPRDAVAAMARVAGAPVYADSTTHLGAGVVGGFMIDYEELGRDAGRLLGQVLARESTHVPVRPLVSSIKLHVDWRQVQRWGINPRAVPSDAVVHFRKPPFHEAYRKEVLVAAGVFALQAGLIGGLLWQRRRRRLAETVAARHRFELVHASRVAVAGELAGAIAHEINQPLAAILSNAEAADIVLESGQAETELLRNILADIRRDDVRASEVIHRLRALLQKQRVEPHRLDLNEILTDVGLVMLPEARRRRVRLELRPAPIPAATFGDRIQLQQVVINLALNAMEAMSDVAEERRWVEVGVAVDPATVAITVRDNGPGIPPQVLERVFESFFTTKASGMGLGLSIVRTIVEAHGGRIHAGNGPDGGAVFHIDLPAVPAADPGTQEDA